VKILELANADDPKRFGNKAATLARGLQKGLPVPDGVVLDAQATEAIVAGDAELRSLLRKKLAALGGAWAVRSSAVGEDGAKASHAGQHLTLLNVRGAAAAFKAIREVHASLAHSASYRKFHRTSSRASMSVLIQRIVAAEQAGVLFTRDPITGKRATVIEAAVGLGEAVVSGEIVPDRFVLDGRGKIVSSEKGTQTKALRPKPGGTKWVALRHTDELCLTSTQLTELANLAKRCERAFGAGRDIEWAFDDEGTLWLLQTRPITGA
jgi:pyruvate, water dikinase